jgi:flagellar assembly protein FliH
VSVPRKLISGSELTVCEQWELPVVGDPDGGATGGTGARGRPLTAAQLEALQAQAYQEGFEQGRREGAARGHREGLQAGERETRTVVEHLTSVLRTLSAPLEALDREVEEALVGLAVAVARHLIRRELKLDPSQVIAVVREAVSVLPVAARAVRLHLHPSDAAIVRERMRLTEGEESAWQLREDPSLTRGGCRVSTEVSEVDATVESRLAAVVASVLGEERVGERPT